MPLDASATGRIQVLGLSPDYNSLDLIPGPGKEDAVGYLLELSRSSPAMGVLLLSTATMFAVALSFLVAAWRLRRANNRKAAAWARLEASWGTLVESVALGYAEPEALHRRIASKQWLIFLDYLYKLSVSEKRPERRALYRELAHPYVDVLEGRAREGDVWQRARAIRTIAELVGGDVNGAVMAALDDDAPHVALTAARTYARLGLGPIEPLLDRIERYQAWDRRLLRLTLSSLGPGAAPALHARFTDRSAAPRIRAVCADALADLSGIDANESAVAVLREETDVDLRAAALRLMRAPASERHRFVVRSLCAAEDPVVRAQAVACLARIGNDADLGEVERALADLSPWVVINASRGLSRRRSPDDGGSGGTGVIIDADGHGPDRGFGGGLAVADGEGE